MLLALGADPARPAADGSTPLDVAESYGHEAIVAVLGRASRGFAPVANHPHIRLDPGDEHFHPELLTDGLFTPS